MSIDIGTLKDAGFFTPLEVRFAAAMGRIAGEDTPLALLGAALAVHHTGEGHVCVEIPRVAGSLVETPEGQGLAGARFPGVDEWLAALNASPLVSEGGETTPLVLDGRGRLYLRKYWQQEAAVAAELGRRAQAAPAFDRAVLDACLEAHSGPAVIEGDQNLQRLAAERAKEGLLTVVTGGPGTGKTTAAVQILLVLVDYALRTGERPPDIAALAPTGKAATRLEEVLRRAALNGEPAARPEVLRALPEAAGTVHRALLGMGPPHGPLARDGARRKLPHDVVLVDETSMVDLTLMYRLVTSLKPGARLVLIGDRNQLASVESGAVLADISDAARSPESPLSRCVIELVRGHRFGAASGIGELAGAINRGDPDATLAYLEGTETPDVAFVPLEDRSRVVRRLGDLVARHLGPLYRDGRVAAHLEGLGRFRLLSAHRRGTLGQEGLNRFVEEWLAREGLVRIDRPWYAGRPVLVTKNDYDTGLFNGDMGIVLPRRPGSAEVAAFFLTPDGTVREVATARLPAVETAFCITVHKSQGSELDHAALILPETRSPVVTRELLYTACTRAKKEVTVFGSKQVIREAVATQIHRASGLMDRLVGR